MPSKDQLTKLMDKFDFENPLKLTQDGTLTEKRAILYIIIGCIIFGLTSFHIKLTQRLFIETFDPNSFMLWRSLSCCLITLALVNYKSERIIQLNEINEKFWFGVRCFINYTGITSLVICMVYLRAATAACMSSMSPAIMIIFSIMILGEKFHWRYVYGVIICFIGTAMIVLNEKKPTGTGKEEDKANFVNLVIGSFFGICHLIFNALINVSQKKLAAERIPIDTQLFYIGFSNVLCAVVVCVFTMRFEFDIKFILFSFLNGFVFYYSVYFMNEGLKKIDLAKTTPFYYLGTLTVFFLGVIVLGEQIYFTDIVGSLLILAYNLYNSLVPFEDHNVDDKNIQ